MLLILIYTIFSVYFVEVNFIPWVSCPVHSTTTISETHCLLHVTYTVHSKFKTFLFNKMDDIQHSDTSLIITPKRGRQKSRNVDEWAKTKKKIQR